MYVCGLLRYDEVIDRYGIPDKYSRDNKRASSHPNQCCEISTFAMKYSKTLTYNATTHNVKPTLLTLDFAEPFFNV